MTELHKAKQLGFVYEVCAGFQFDLNSVNKKVHAGYSEGHFCDHNCTSEYGNYDCPAAFSRNKDVVPHSMMDLSAIRRALEVAKDGLRLANQQFLEQHFERYTQAFAIPNLLAESLRELLRPGQLELNMFGGNPELHPEFVAIIGLAQELGYRVTTTTTGKRMLHDEEFVQGFLANPPQLLAVSADDFESLDELQRLLDMGPADLRRYWQKANPLYGQRKKAYESIYVAQLLRQHPDRCALLFNIVVHPGNLHFVDDLMRVLHEHFPNAWLNPYPAQASFSFGQIEWEPRDLPRLGEFLERMIERQLTEAADGTRTLVPRLHYWLALQSAFTSSRDLDEAARYLMGYGVWTCYRQPGAGRYLQAGSAQVTQQATFAGGGHPGCFWNNSTVTDPTRQLWNMTPQEVAEHLLLGKMALARQANPACPGCIMPRLMFDGISVELGLNPRLVPEYLRLRQIYVGF